jgi:hypothetical protein
VCDLEISEMRSPWPTLGHSTTRRKRNYVSTLNSYTFQPTCGLLQAVYFLQDNGFVLRQYILAEMCARDV